MSEMALRLIEQAKREKWKVLDLGNCGIVGAVPEEVGELEELEELYLSEDWFVPGGRKWEMIKTKNRGARNQIEVFPTNLPPKITALALGDSHILDLEGILSCPDLAYLDLDEAVAIEDVSPIRRLTKLQTLNLYKTRIQEIESIRSLTHLLALSLARTNVRDFAPLNGLVNLRILDLAETSIADISSFREFAELQMLNIQGTKVESISSLRPQIAKNIRLLVGNCPLADPPHEIAKRGNGAILEYWREQDRIGTLPSTDIKLFLLGNTTAGKSTLRHALIQQEYNEAVSSTHGGELHETWRDGDITLHLWDFGGQEYFHATHRLFLESKSEAVLNLNLPESGLTGMVGLHAWDMIGPEYSHSTYRVNLGPDVSGSNSLHLVVADPKFDSSGYHLTPIKHVGESESHNEELEHFHHDYWLEMVQRTAPQGPVWMVWNKLDQSDLPAYGLTDAERKRFEKGKLSEVELSVKAAFSEGKSKWKLRFEAFREEVLEAAREKLKGQTVIKYWPSVREAMEERSKTDLWISWEEFVRICKDDDPLRELGLIITYLRDMCGAILYWEAPGLRDKVFINPNKINQLIYAVLDREVKERLGRFGRAHAETQVRQALAALHGADAQAQDIPATTETLLAVMREFQIIFEVAEGAGEYVAPQYLGREEPETVKVAKEHASHAPAYKVRFKSYVPRHIIPRFIVAKGLLAKQGHYWKFGIIFTDGGVSACVQVDYERREIAVRMQNPGMNLELQRRISSELRDLCEIDDLLEVAPEGKEYVALAELLGPRNPRNTWCRDVNGNDVEIRPYTLFMDLATFEHYHPKMEAMDSKKPVKLFISYSSADDALKSEFDKHTAVLRRNKRIESWHMGVFKPSMDWDREVQAALDGADIVVMLLSASFFASDYIWNKEFQNTLERWRRGEVKIAGIVLSKCGWRDTPLKEIQLISRGKVVVEQGNRDGAWFDAVEDLKRILE